MHAPRRSVWEIFCSLFGVKQNQFDTFSCRQWNDFRTRLETIDLDILPEIISAGTSKEIVKGQLLRDLKDFVGRKIARKEARSTGASNNLHY